MTLHKVLPFLYAIGGLCMMCNVASSLSYNIGMLFMLLACLTWMKRLGPS
ncbi:MAG: hypothetical protein R3F42_09385 [Pseudomonadota bacterium]